LEKPCLFSSHIAVNCWFSVRMGLTYLFPDFLWNPSPPLLVFSPLRASLTPSCSFKALGGSKDQNVVIPCPLASLFLLFLFFPDTSENWRDPSVAVLPGFPRSSRTKYCFFSPPFFSKGVVLTTLGSGPPPPIRDLEVCGTRPLQQFPRPF